MEDGPGPRPILIKPRNLRSRGLCTIYGAATGMADLGVQPHVIEAVLNHISGHKAGGGYL